MRVVCLNHWNLLSPYPYTGKEQMSWKIYPTLYCNHSDMTFYCAERKPKYRLCLGHQILHNTIMPRSPCQERAAGRAAGGVRAAAAGAREDAGRRGGRPRHLGAGAHSRAAGRQRRQADRRHRQVHRSHWALSSSYQHP